MKKTVAGLLGVFAVGMLSIGGWYVVHNQRADAEASEADARKNAANMIPVQIVVKPSQDTPDNQMLYICGSAPNMGNWQAESGVPLERKGDGAWVGTVELMNGVNYAFKVNRGTWSTVERGPNDEEIPNHDFVAESGKPVEVSVASWVDHGKSTPGRMTNTGAIIVHSKFPSKQVQLPRDIVVYLPPDYETSEERRYPVLYMLDGQNLFNEATSFNGIEWKMDETAQRLIQGNMIQPIIIVGIYNTEQRTPEFTPPGMGTGAKGELAKARGDAFGKFIVEELKPFIDARYRTMTDRAHSAIGGSAMGGLASLYVAKAHGDVFGAVAVCSPWLRSPDGQSKLMPEYTGDPKWLKSTRWYIDMGTEGAGAGYPPNTDPKDVNKPEVAQDALNDARALVAAFDSAGMTKGKEYVYEEIPGGEFNEPSWQARVEPMLKALFPPGAAATSRGL